MVSWTDEGQSESARTVRTASAVPDDDGRTPAQPTPAASGPLVGEAGDDRFYATRLRQLVHLDLDEADAAAMWRNVERHRAQLERQLGREVGLRVALLDYVVNVRRQLVDPRIVESATLTAMEHQATADALTQLYNRHHFDVALEREVNRCLRSGMSSSLLLLDLDRFKEINDTLGHQVGDRVLQAVSECLRRHVRGADVPCRFGGDEFAIILCDTPRGDALAVAERIRVGIGSLFELRPLTGDIISVTASGGVATVPNDARSAHQLFARADQALYEAKRGGGNRIVGAGAERPPPAWPEQDRRAPPH